MTTPIPTTRSAIADSWGGDTQDVHPDDGVVQLAAGDPMRRTTSIVTDVDSIGTLYLVPNAGQSSGGVRIVPGAGWTFAHSAPVYAYATGGPVTVTTVVESGVQC